MEPLSDGFVLNLHLVEEGQDLAVELGFRDSRARMIGLRVAGTAVVDVGPLAVLGLLRFVLAGDRMAAVTAANELARVGHLVGVIDVLAEQRLHAVPSGTIDERLMLAGIPVAEELNLADVGPVAKRFVDFAAWELPGARPPLAVFAFELCHECIERQRFIREEMKHSPDVVRRDLIKLHDTATVLADIAVTIRSLADKPAFTNSASQAFANVYRLLLCVEARHVGERATHHAACRIAFGRLRDADKANVVFRFEPLNLDKVKEIACRPVHLVDQQAIKFGAMLLGVSDQLAERFPFVALARRFGNAKQPQDRAALRFGISLQGIFLNVEREALPFLFPTADSGKCNVLFHGSGPREMTPNNRPTERIIVTASSGVRGVS